MSVTVWLVLAEDRHTDVEAEPFSTEAAAVERAWEIAADNADGRDRVTEEELSESARDDDWVLLLEYGTEGDCVRVLKRKLDAGPL